MGRGLITRLRTSPGAWWRFAGWYVKRVSNSRIGSNVKRVSNGASVKRVYTVKNVKNLCACLLLPPMPPFFPDPPLPKSDKKTPIYL